MWGSACPRPVPPPHDHPRTPNYIIQRHPHDPTTLLVSRYLHDHRHSPPCPSSFPPFFPSLLRCFSFVISLMFQFFSHLVHSSLIFCLFSLLFLPHFSISFVFHFLFIFYLPSFSLSFLCFYSFFLVIPLLVSFLKYLGLIPLFFCFPFSYLPYFVIFSYCVTLFLFTILSILCFHSFFPCPFPDYPIIMLTSVNGESGRSEG